MVMDTFWQKTLAWLYSAGIDFGGHVAVKRGTEVAHVAGQFHHGRWVVMKRLGASALLCGLCAVASAISPVTNEVTFPSQDNGILLNGYWTAPPAGQTNAPAVVALHGCGGLPSDRGQLDYARSRYIRILHDAGMGVLYVDSFGPRGLRGICEIKPSERSVTELSRRLDVLGAMQWLSLQVGVDAKRLVVMGWSHGGQTVLAMADSGAEVVANASLKPAALLAFYPGCGVAAKQLGYKAAAPLLVMSGELDNWTPALSCRRLTENLKRDGQPVRYVEYPGAYHAFDSAAPVIERKNVGGTKSGTAMMGGNLAARTASAEEMLRFLGNQLGFTPNLELVNEGVHGNHVPNATDFAVLSDVDRIPAGSSAKALYKEWLEKPFPRAVAISNRGALARAYGRTAMEAAIKNCEKFNNPCHLYAVDDRVVWAKK
jgi:dienelactone hydrolase